MLLILFMFPLLYSFILEKAGFFKGHFVKVVLRPGTQYPPVPLVNSILSVRLLPPVPLVPTVAPVLLVL